SRSGRLARDVARGASAPPRHRLSRRRAAARVPRGSPSPARPSRCAAGEHAGRARPAARRAPSRLRMTTTPGDAFEAGLAIADALQAAGIPYALGGALAYGQYGIPRAT